jgi:NADPH-dependent 2,4-dienoyl-CoA reductase/sulfur reductase-like enzyme
MALTLLDCTSVIAAPFRGVLLAEHEDSPVEIHWERLVLATGARELFLPFPGWTLPGVLGPGGLQTLVKNGWPIEGQRVVVAGSGPLLLAVASGLAKHNARVVCVAEQAPWQQVLGFGLSLWKQPTKLWQAVSLKLGLRGVPYRCGAWPVRAEGEEQIRSVTLTDGRRTWSEECDLLACGFGLLPNLELPLALGCELNCETVKINESQATSVSGVYCAGEPTGIAGADCALIEGQIAGYAAAGRNQQAQALFTERDSWHEFSRAMAKAFRLRAELKTLATDETIVCRCEDVTFGRLREFRTWREAKLQSRCGMGSCQGRVCGGAAKVLFGWGMESVRPPILPVRVHSLISQVNAESPENSLQEAPGSKRKEPGKIQAPGPKLLGEPH